MTRTKETPATTQAKRQAQLDALRGLGELVNLLAMTMVDEPNDAAIRAESR